MDGDLQLRLERFLRPLYQDLDGSSRTDDAERIAAIARRIYDPPNPAASRSFELLLRFHLLGRWLEKIGNLSRTVLAVGGLEESELRETAAAIRRLEAPATAAEQAVAAAILIDHAGVRGLTGLFASARRDGNSLMDVLRAALSDANTPEWLPEKAAPWLEKRREARRSVCRQLLEELQLEDLQ
jgi:hypothetical protein